MLPPIRVLIADDQRVVRDDLAMLAALIDGAHGYLTKDASAEQIEAAIRAVCAGQTHLDPPIQERLVAAVTGPPPEQAAAGACPLPAGLTAREAEVLTLLAAGLSNAGIAQRLLVSNATVKTHLNRIFAKTAPMRSGTPTGPGWQAPLPDRSGAPSAAGRGGRRLGTPHRRQAPSPDRRLWRNGSQ